MTKNYCKFWGTRGSCAVSGESFQKFGGNSSALEIRYGDTIAIIDAGTGIRPLGQELLKQKVRRIELFLSHTHWDHLIGFPFFDPIYEPGVHITVWAPPNIGRTNKELFSDLLAPEFFPVRFDQVQATLEFKTIQQKTPVAVGPLEFDFHITNHPGITFAFNIKTPHQTISYCTDNELLQGYHDDPENAPEELTQLHQSLIEFLKGTDILIHEAQYTPEEYRLKVGWGHSSTVNACYLVKRTQASQWLVTHHDPSHTDEDLKVLEGELNHYLKKQQIPCAAQWIGDGYVLPLK